MANNKAQIWFTDFVVAVMIFSLMLISYYTYTINISKEDFSAMDNLIKDAKVISSSFTTGGSPADWNYNNVEIIGFTDDNNKIDNDKFIQYTNIDYNESKKLLGTAYDYVLFFVNSSDDVQGVEGYCGTGSSEIMMGQDIFAAYYHKDEVNLKQFMIDEFDADIYNDSGPTIDNLLANINDYGLVVIESPEFSTDTKIYTAVKNSLEEWVGNGGFFMQSGRPFAANGKEMLGVTFNKITGDAGKDKPATVIRNDQHIVFSYGEQIIFNQVYYVEDVAIGANLIDIARFNESDIEIEDIMDNKIALARWPYIDGEVIFFSDFDAEYLAGDFQKILETSTRRWIGGTICLPINITDLDRDNLVKTERLVIHNSDQLKMVLYLWN